MVRYELVLTPILIAPRAYLLTLPARMLTRMPSLEAPGLTSNSWVASLAHNGGDLPHEILERHKGKRLGPVHGDPNDIGRLQKIIRQERVGNWRIGSQFMALVKGLQFAKWPIGVVRSEKFFEAHASPW